MTYKTQGVLWKYLLDGGGEGKYLIGIQPVDGSSNERIMKIGKKLGSS